MVHMLVPCMTMRHTKKEKQLLYPWFCDPEAPLLSSIKKWIGISVQPIQARSPPASLRATALAPSSVLGRVRQIGIRRGPSHRTSRFHSELQIGFPDRES